MIIVMSMITPSFGENEEPSGDRGHKKYALRRFVAGLFINQKPEPTICQNFYYFWLQRHWDFVVLGFTQNDPLREKHSYHDLTSLHVG
ncbi:hypothetical protein MKZ15_16895 [Paenibacillus sp. FSL R7-0216]|uniref:hypothetical protein n=1 Tax=Paenibacillus sp. FSL R7-0216 TaxID=2921677 RepID=UPI0030DA8BCF